MANPMTAHDRKLTPEVRRRVAEYVTGHEHMVVDGIVWRNFMGGPDNPFRPDKLLEHKDALTHKLAQVIKSKRGLELTSDGILFYVLLERFNEALATNDTTALEALLAELMGE